MQVAELHYAVEVVVRVHVKSAAVVYLGKVLAKVKSSHYFFVVVEQNLVVAVAVAVNNVDGLTQVAVAVAEQVQSSAAKNP